MKKILAFLLCFAMLFSIPAMAVNATGETQVVGGTGASTVAVTAEATQMTVTVPTILPAVVDAQGNVTVATDAQVQNHSYGPVEFNSIQAEALNGWTLVNGSHDFTKDKVGAKNIAVSVDNVYAENGNIKLKTLPWVVNGNDNTRGFAYGLKIPAQRNAVTASNLAKVIFTVDWYEGGTNTAENEVSTLSLDKDYITMYVNASETIHAKAETKTQRARLFSMRAAQANGVEWSADNDNVTVSNGHVTANAVGESVVTASYNGLEATCRVKVAEAPIPLQAIAFSKNKVTLFKGESETVLLTYNPDKFTGSVDVNLSKSGNETGVTVSPASLSGVTADDGPTAVTITGNSGGTSTITATASVGGKTVSATLQVEVVVPLESLAINGPNTVTVGETIELTATKSPTDAQGDVTWSSSDESLATVDQNGVVTGVAEGEVEITAECGGVKARYEVAVKVPELIADYAVLYSDGTLAFQSGNKPKGGHGNIVNSWAGEGGWATESFDYYNSAQWYDDLSLITHVEFIDKTCPVSTKNWFYRAEEITDINTNNLDTSNVTNMQRT